MKARRAVSSGLLCLAASMILGLGRAAEGPVRPDDPSLVFAPPVLVGASTGFAADLIGCTNNGATLSNLTVWANSDFLRGVQATLTDGRTALWGCVNTTLREQTGGDVLGCNDSDIRNASFSFQDDRGERVRSLTLWPATDKQGNADARAGYIHFETSLGRVFDFGKTGPRPAQNPIDVASGIPCGISVRRGADIDAIGFVFLQPLHGDPLLAPQHYDGLECGMDCGSDLAPTIKREMVPIVDDTFCIVQNPTTSGNPNNRLFGSVSSGIGSSEAWGRTSDGNMTVSPVSVRTLDPIVGHEGPSHVDMIYPQPTWMEWQYDRGLDTYLSGNTVTANVPDLATASGSHIPVALQTFNNSRAFQSSPDAVQRVAEMHPPVDCKHVEANVTVTRLETRYTGQLSVSLESGGYFTILVTGKFRGAAVSDKAELVVTDVAVPGPPASPPPSPPASPPAGPPPGPPSDVSALSLPRDMHAEMASSHRARDATLAAIVLGIMLALCLLVGLALCIVMNHRRRKQGGLEEGAAGKASPGGSGTPALGVPIFFATKRDGLGTPGDHKQPPSPIQGFTEVTIPEPPRPARVPLKARVQALFGIHPREQLDELDPNEAYLELAEGPIAPLPLVAKPGNEAPHVTQAADHEATAGGAQSPGPRDAATASEAAPDPASPPASPESPGTQGPQDAAAEPASASNAVGVPDTSASSPSGAGASPVEPRGESSNQNPASDVTGDEHAEGDADEDAREHVAHEDDDDGRDYDPDVAHWTKPPIPSEPPTGAGLRGAVEHEDTMIRTAGKSLSLVDPATGEIIKLGSRR